MKKNRKRILSLLVAFSLITPNAVYAGEDKSIWDTIADFFGQTVEDTTSLAADAWDDASTKADDAWNDLTSWTARAWEDSSSRVAKAWDDSKTRIAGRWDDFILWANVAASGNPYSWMDETVAENGIRGYDRLEGIRTFLEGDPDLEQIHARCEEALDELSLSKEDRNTLWKMLTRWSEEKKLPPARTAEIALPFLERLVIEGESVIDGDVVFSGPVIGQYLMTILTAMGLDSAEAADLSVKLLSNTLAELKNPAPEEDAESNALLTEAQSDSEKGFLQAMYYDTASRSVSACFDDGAFRFLDAEGNPMAVEVSADQYDAAVDYMKNRIANGEVPGVSDPERAVDIVKKGILTYDQARNIAKAGIMESISYDPAEARVAVGTPLGMSAAAAFALNIWNGEEQENAIRESALAGLETGGTAFIASVLTALQAETDKGSALAEATAALQKAENLLHGDTQSAADNLAPLSAEDVADRIRGKISWEELSQNLSSAATEAAGDKPENPGEEAPGTAVFPEAGTIAGIIFSLATGWEASEGVASLADMIAENDAAKMIEIIEEQFSAAAPDYFLNEKEVDEAVENLKALVSADWLKQMLEYRNNKEFTRPLIERTIEPVVAEREYIKLPDIEEYVQCLTGVLESISDDSKGSKGSNDSNGTNDTNDRQNQ